MTYVSYIVPHQRSSPVDNLLYFMFEFQPIAQYPRVKRRGQIYEKSKVNNETSANFTNSTYETG